MYLVSLEAARVNARLSQKKAAKAMDVNPSTIANWESGKTAINADQFKKLCELYKVPMDVISLPKKIT